MKYVGVKIWKDGEPTGREYTYTVDFEVSEGELVIGDMAGHEKLLVVTNMDIPNDIEFSFDIKSLLRTANDEDMKNPEAKVDIEVREESLPVIKINFDELKSNLEKELEKYKNLEVTSETLKGCKQTQKELAGLKKKIDRYRLDKTKELSKPLDMFGKQCKELVGLVEKVEQPIKEKISLFDDEKREKKREEAEKIIKNAAKAIELKEKYKSQLTVIDKYCNLTAKKSDVRADVEVRAEALLKEQQAEEQNLEIIKDSIEIGNKTLTTKLDIKDYERLINGGTQVKDILAQIKTAAQKIREAEAKPKEEPQAPKVETKPEPVQKSSGPEFYAVFKVFGSAAQLKEVAEYLQLKEFRYKVEEQGHEE